MLLAVTLTANATRLQVAVMQRLTGERGLTDMEVLTIDKFQVWRASTLCPALCQLNLTESRCASLE